jgi:hypothetical protein
LVWWAGAWVEATTLAELYSYSIPNLIQGISQQPDSQRDPSQGEIQVNGMSSIAEGLRKRDGTNTLAKVSDAAFGDAYFHSVLRDENEEYLAVITKTSIKVFDLAGNQKTVSAPDGYGYLSTITDARNQIRASTIADYTWVLNTLKSPEMDSALSPVTARPATHEALIWVKAANYGQKYTVTLNGTTVTVTTATAAVIVAGTTVTEVKISAAEIADAIKTGLAGVTGVTIDQSGSVLHLKSSSAMTLKATDARANADITAITNSVQSFTELPTIGPRGYQIEIDGDPGNKWDGYYVEFRPREGLGNFGEGSWVETVAPGTQYKLKPSTMPHALVRLPDGTFYFGPVDGRTVGTVKLPKWGERTCGDYDTVPDPSFVGKSINDMFVYRNRLGLLSDEAVVLSRSGEFFEFFPETATTILDSDPIDISSSNNRISVLRYAVPYQDELVIFSPQSQFRLSSGDQPLTSQTARLTVLTQYEADMGLRPSQVGSGVFFAQQNDVWSRFREFALLGSGSGVVANAVDISDHVSAYLPSDMFKMAANDTGNVLFFVSARSGYENRIYVYKFFNRSDGQSAQRVQASWSYWDFAGCDKVLSILCVRESLYCLMQYGTKVYLEVISVMDRLAEETGTPYPMLLDRRVSNTTVTSVAMRMANGVYNAATETTTWTLPYTANTTTQLWSGYSLTPGRKIGGVLLATISSGTTFTCRGDWSNADVFAGVPYQFRYRFSRFKTMKDVGIGKAASNTIRTQVRNAKLRYHETGYFEVTVSPEHRPTATYKFDGTILATRGSAISAAPNEPADAGRYYEGVFSIPIASRGEQCIVEVVNSTPLPCKFSTCEWTALLTAKSKSL